MTSMANPFHAASLEAKARMFIHLDRYRQRADRAEVSLRPLQPLTVQLLILEICGTLLACLLVLLAMGLLAVQAAVLDEAAGMPCSIRA